MGPVDTGAMARLGATDSARWSLRGGWFWPSAQQAVGLLFALNEWVAIDAGMRLTFVVELDDPKSKKLIVPIGYFGLQAFF